MNPIAPNFKLILWRLLLVWVIRFMIGGGGGGGGHIIIKATYVLLSFLLIFRVYVNTFDVQPINIH